MAWEESRVSRFMSTVLLVFGAGFWAFAIGTFLGGRFLVPPGQGLAGPVEAMGYGLLAFIAAGTVAIILGIKLKGRTVLIAGLVSFLSAAILFGVLYARTVMETRAIAEEDAKRPRPVTKPVESNALSSPDSLDQAQ